MRCAACSGKRVRPPNDAVIAAAIEAAQGPIRENLSIEERVKQRSKRQKTENANKNGSKSRANWMEAAERVLSRVFRMHVSEVFRFPVDLDILTDYTNFVENPMDLDTIRNELFSYESPLDVVQRVKLIVENCVAYNGEDSKYSASAKHMLSSFRRIWRKEGLPLTESDDMREDLIDSLEEQDTDVNQEDSIAHLIKGTPAPDWQRRAGKLLSQLSRLESTVHFLRPVPKGFMNYHEVIMKPMDLGTIKNKLSEGGYINPAHLVADVELVWANCKRFNQPGTPIVEDCENAKAEFEKAWLNSQIMTDDGTAGHAKLTQQPSRTDDWVEQARGVLYRLINFVPQASWFYDPVDEEEAPGYSEAVKNPIDLHTISEKLRGGLYPAPGNLLADMELLRRNVELYNGPDSELTEGATAVAVAFKKYWANAGLGAAIVPMDGANDWITSAVRMIDDVLLHPTSWPFSKPVNERTAPGYSKIVKKPMDFSTVKFNLEQGLYSSPGQVTDDVALIFQNCRAYNPPGDEIRAMGSEIEAFFRSNWESNGLPVPRRWKKR